MSPAETLDDTDVVRARLYRLLGRLLAKPPDAAVLQLVGGIEGGGAGAPLDEALAALARAAGETEPAAARREYDALFIGVGRGELVPYASWYLTGFVGEWPLARLRDDMAALGIARGDDVHEPEDHIAALCEMMGGLIDGAFGAPASRERQTTFFGTHLAPWASRFFTDLERCETAAFYRAVGSLGRGLFEIEAGLLQTPEGSGRSDLPGG